MAVHPHVTSVPAQPCFFDYSSCPTAVMQAAAASSTPATPTPMPSTRSHLADTLKPFKNEALIRLRSSLVGLVVLVLATALFPVPSLWSAARIVRGPFPWDWSLAWAISAVGPCALRCRAVDFVCSVSVAELVVAALLALNFIQAVYALRYPRTPLPPPPASPARSLGLATPQPKQRRPIVAHSVRFLLSFRLCVHSFVSGQPAIAAQSLYVSHLARLDALPRGPVLPQRLDGLFHHLSATDPIPRDLTRCLPRPPCHRLWT